MSSTTSALVARLAGSLALLAALAGSLFVAPATVAQDGGNASITVHARVCPERYEGTDLYETCHDTAPEPGLPFTLSDGVTEDGTTDENGDLTFDGLAAGAYELTGGAPGEFTEERIFCALEQDLGDPIGADEITGGVRISVEDGQNVICDWFIIPQGQGPPADGGTLTIYKATCPPGYTRTDVFTECFQNATADVQFVVGTTATDNVESATTGPEGFVTFDLEPFLIGPESTITFGEVTVPDGADPVVVCTDADGANVQIIDVATIGFEGVGPVYAVTIAPEPDDQIRCDWYNRIPPDTEPPTEDATVTIYKTACPPGYDGDDYFADCFDDPQAGVEFFLARGGGGVEGTTGTDGFVTLVLPGDALPGVATAQESVPAGFAVDFVVACTEDDGATVLDVEQNMGAPGPGGETTFFATFEVDGGDQIRCDWYNIPPAPETPAPTPTPDPNARPAAIREGDCDDEELGEVVVELTGVSQPEGETVGQDDASLAATSFTLVDLSLDQIVAEDHVITIGEPAADATDDPVVCGEIGGVLDGNGDLVIGLAEQDDSGYTGIAFLSPDADDPDQTAVSVFIAEDLGEDDEEDLDLDETEDDAEATEAA